MQWKRERQLSHRTLTSPFNMAARCLFLVFMFQTRLVFFLSQVLLSGILKGEVVDHKHRIQPSLSCQVWGLFQAG